MGFAAVAATSILLIAGLQMVATAVPDAVDANAALHDARTDAWDRAQRYAHMDARVDTVAGAGPITLNATNTGDEILDASTILVLVDGTPVEPTSWTVDGNPSNVWTPGQEAAFTIPASGSVHAIVLPSGQLIPGGI